MGYDQERRARALEIYRQMGWGENEIVKEIDEELWKLITDVTFGEMDQDKKHAISHRARAFQKFVEACLA